MKTWISIFLLVALLPGTVFAEELDLELVPKPNWTVEGDRACMSFEDTQLLVRMREQYTTLYELVPRLQLEADMWHDMSVEALHAADYQREAYTDLFTVYTDTENRLETEIEARTRAERFSIFQGALPWVITGAAVVFVGGVYLGAKL